MLLLVHFIALLVQVYSVAYMKHDPDRYRYFAFLQLFIFSMLGIVLAGGLLVMYIFWELVGLSSYLLIGFWYKKPRAVWAAKKAFILNRIGDAAFLTGILLLLHYTGATTFAELPTAILSLSPALLTTIGICLFGGAVGKSAQFPLSAWLPDAMEGPTPVSALIHAATMVAAGIFLLARISFLLTPNAQLVVAVVGTITMLHGAWKATQAWDIKQVLAYSTISQLGLMVLAAGVGSSQVAIFHLLTHAFFKAGLFLSAGSVIHALESSDKASTFDPQDMRTMGGLRTVMPRTFICFVVCAAALAGLPLFSGFLSKDAIFLAAFARAGEVGSWYYILPVMAVLAAGFTAYYMVRQLWLVFMGESRFITEVEVKPHESPALMWAPMALLALGSLFFWFSPNPIDASGWFLHLMAYQEGFHALWVPGLSVLVTGLGLALGYRRAIGAGFLPEGSEQEEKEETAGRFKLLADFDTTNQQYIFFIVPFQKIAHFCVAMEKRVIDYLVNGIGRTTVVLAHLLSWTDRNITAGGVKVVIATARGAGGVVRLFQNGKIQSYFVVTFISILLLLLWTLMLG
jgi:NADH-quinone oxidoreductase subunit L